MPENYNNWIVGTAVLAFVAAMATDVVDLDIAMTVAAWLIPETYALSSAVRNRSRKNNINKNHHWLLQSQQQLLSNANRRSSLLMADDDVASDETSESTSPTPMSFLESAEWKIIEDLHGKALKKAADDSSSSENDEDAFQAAAEELLPALSPTLIMKLRSGDDLVPEDAKDDKSNDRLLKIFSEVSRALNTMTDRRLESARDVLRELMTAGEIKKLDAKIGKNAREKKLDVAFFQVLQMNIQDAALESQKASAAGEEEGSEAVDRLQILQHIYTRCQEEVEKVINPGTALLNKLLRTEVNSIRENQLNHYLCPKPTTITSPDGKELVLNNGIPSKPLVAQDDFCEAIGNAVKQIRTVEKSGATTPEIAADLVETVRTIAKEARFVIGEHFGANSTEVIGFEEALEPVFRPVSRDSVYIQGEA